MSSSQDKPSSTEEHEDQQLCELKDMMQDLQQGFTAAMMELSKIQYEDRQLADRLDNSKQQHEAQITDILEIVKALKVQCDGVQSQVENSNRRQRKLEKQMKKMRSARQQAYTTNSSGSGKHVDSKLYSSPLMKSFIASLPPPEEMDEIVEDGDDEFTAHRGAAAAAAAAAADAEEEEEEEEDLGSSDSELASITHRSLHLTNTLLQTAFKMTSAAPRKSMDHTYRSASVRQHHEPVSSHAASLDLSDGSSSIQSSSGSQPHDIEGRVPHHPSHLANRANQISYQHPTEPHHTTRSIVQRRKMVGGLLESERSYCKTLYNLTNGTYSQQLLSSGAITAQEFSRIFPVSLLSLYDYHCASLRSLKSRFSKSRGQDVIVGDVFARMTSRNHKTLVALANPPLQSSDFKLCSWGIYMTAYQLGIHHVVADSTPPVVHKMDLIGIYKDYIGNFTSALDTIKDLMAYNDRYKVALAHCQPDNGSQSSGADLSQLLLSQLLAPVRRLPTYTLYIKKLLQHTDLDHPDHYFLETSLDVFCAELHNINEVVERTVQLTSSTNKHTTNTGISKRSVDTSSYSSHEEDQRLSTATKDSGIHSNCDLDVHEELSSPRLTARSRSIGGMLDHGLSIGSSERREIRLRPRSVVDFTRYADVGEFSSLPRHSKTPTASMNALYSATPAGKSKPSNSFQGSGQSSPLCYHPSPHLLRPGSSLCCIKCSGLVRSQTLKLSPESGQQHLSQSSPNLLDTSAVDILMDPSCTSRAQLKGKHKVQFRSPPAEERIDSTPGVKRSSSKKRSIADTLRIFFNKRKGLKTSGVNRDSSDYAEYPAEVVDVSQPQPSPPQMFANDEQTHTVRTHQLSEHPVSLPDVQNTYEDENGDPYSIV